jgi:prevent-host-death family protein
MGNALHTTGAARVNVAEAKRRFSDLLGRVAYGGESVVITRRGRAMARLVPLEQTAGREHMGNLKGWLEDDDPYFQTIEQIVRERVRHRPRAQRRSPKKTHRR